MQCTASRKPNEDRTQSTERTHPNCMTGRNSRTVEHAGLNSNRGILIILFVAEQATSASTRVKRQSTMRLDLLYRAYTACNCK